MVSLWWTGEVSGIYHWSLKNMRTVFSRHHVLWSHNPIGFVSKVASDWPGRTDLWRSGNYFSFRFKKNRWYAIRRFGNLLAFLSIRLLFRMCAVKIFRNSFSHTNFLQLSLLNVYIRDYTLKLMFLILLQRAALQRRNIQLWRPVTSKCMAMNAHTYWKI